MPLQAKKVGSFFCHYMQSNGANAIIYL